MKTSNKIYTIICTILFFSASLFSQVSGDYRSNGFGKWNVAATWQTFNGTSWVPASVAPSGSENITIQASDSVDVNIPVTITGKIIGLGGKLGNSITNLTFGINGIYEHAVNAGILPIATWGSGSTCLISGITSTIPSNSSQNFYNFSWDCPDYGPSSLYLGWNGNTIGGNINVIKGSSGKPYLRLTAQNIGNQAPGANIITINGDIYILDTNGALTSTASFASDTIAIYVKGNITSYGNFNLASGSGAACNWYLSGDLKLQDGLMTTNSATGALADSFFFVGTTKQIFYKADSLGSINNINFIISPGAIVDLGVTSIGGTFTTFTQSSGTTLITAHPKGLHGNLSMQGSIRLPLDGNYEYNGTVSQIDSLLPAVVNNLTINNPTTVSFSKATTVNGVLTLKQGILDNSIIPVIIGPGGSVVYAGGQTAVDLLPVELSSFSAIQDKLNVILKWSTQTEKNSNKFVIERKKLDAIWESIGSVNAAVLSNSPKQYSFIDKNLQSGKYQYRLKMIDNDGTFEYSKVIETEVAAPKEFDLSQNYPNPFNPSTKIDYQLPVDSKVRLEVCNIAGQKVSELVNQDQSAGYYTIDFGASFKLASGIYIYRLVASDKATGNIFSSIKKMMLLK